jgi:glycosyltransferase involved in cell wall biosynthesis
VNAKVAQASSAGSGTLRGVVLLVTDIDAPSGGIQKNSRLLLKELHDRGVATFACVRNYHRRPKSETIEGTLFHRSAVLGGGLAINGLLYFVSTLLWLVRNRRKYDVIHCQQMFGPTMAAAVATYLVRKPILTRVTTIGELGEVKQIREMPLSSLRLRLIRRVSRWAALTGEMKRELVSLGIPPERISVIHNSTDIPPDCACAAETKPRLRAELGLGTGKIGVFVGRLSEEKNLDLLIAAWAEVCRKFPDAQLLMLGAGGAYRNVEANLHELVSRLDLADSVTFRGHVDRAKDYVTAADVFVLPSRTEGMSNALVEAMACGAAIVATDIPGNAEICSDGDNALLVPVGDRAALVEAITRILESPSLAERLGRAARKKAEDDLSVDHMVSSYLDAYEELLATAS